MIIEVQTTLTPYRDSFLVKPISALFTFFNPSQYEIVINDNYPLHPFSKFGIDLTVMYQPEIDSYFNRKKIPVRVKQNTQFKVMFADKDVSGLDSEKKVILIETFFKISR